MGRQKLMRVPARCTPHQMQKVIARQMAITADKISPEQKLILAVIGCAIADLCTDAYRRNAELFIHQGTFCECCDFIGVDPASTKQLLTRGGFLPQTTTQPTGATHG